MPTTGQFCQKGRFLRRAAVVAHLAQGGARIGVFRDFCSVPRVMEQAEQGGTKMGFLSDRLVPGVKLSVLDVKPQRLSR